MMREIQRPVHGITGAPGNHVPGRRAARKRQVADQARGRVAAALVRRRAGPPDS